MKKILTTLLLLLSLAANAQTPAGINGIKYLLWDEDEERTATVISNDGGYSGDITIPQSVTYNGVAYSVTTIDEEAFYECNGLKGWQSYERTISYLRQRCPNHLIIADAKRGDIGNTSQMYARSFFEEQDVDALTVAPYMGEDSVKPFLGYDGKWVVLLALTSNKGSLDFQLTEDKEGQRLFEKVLRTSLQWGNDENMMYVVGATRGSLFEDVRAIVPDHFLLVPGVGAQGGSLEEVCRYGMNSQCGLLVNSSRGIIFADSSEHFAEVAHNKAFELQQQMEAELNKRLG